MKQKLIVLCGALVVAVATISITVVSRSSANPVSEVTLASVEALTYDEWSSIYAPETYKKKCTSTIAIIDENGNLIYGSHTSITMTATYCHSGHTNCYPWDC